jgi:hypothetical protein
MRLNAPIIERHTEACQPVASKSKLLNSLAPPRRLRHLIKSIVCGKAGFLGGLVLAEFEIDVFGITASITLKRSQIVPLRCGFNLNQVDVLSALGTHRR